MQPQSRSALVAPSSPSTTLTSPRAGQPFVAIDGLEGWERLLAGRPVPACAVNLDALQANRRILEAMAAKGGARVRLSTAALRSTGLLRYLLTAPGHQLQGLYCMSVYEAEVLAELGFDDLLIATPVARPRAARVLAALVAAGRMVVPTVDSSAHLALLAAAAAEAEVEIGVCIDVDVSWQPAAEVWIGTRRSALRERDEARRLGALVAATPGLHVVGVSAWEAQLARPAGRGPAAWFSAPFRGIMRSRSAELASARRREVVDALKEDGHPIAMVVGGSTGSMRTVIEDTTVTDIPIGEGILCPVRCDGHGLGLLPALHFALPVTRRPDAEHVTCHGGGYVSAGAIAGSPVVIAPEGLHPISSDGWSQVQTPLRVNRGEAPAVGSLVVCRPYRSADVLERFNDIVLHSGEEVVEVVPTYRALGLATG